MGIKHSVEYGNILTNSNALVGRCKTRGTKKATFVSKKESTIKLEAVLKARDQDAFDRYSRHRKDSWVTKAYHSYAKKARKALGYITSTHNVTHNNKYDVTKTTSSPLTATFNYPKTRAISTPLRAVLFPTYLV